MPADRKSIVLIRMLPMLRALASGHGGSHDGRALVIRKVEAVCVSIPAVTCACARRGSSAPTPSRTIRFAPESPGPALAHGPPGRTGRPHRVPPRSVRRSLEPLASARRAVQLGKHHAHQTVARRCGIRSAAVEDAGRVNAGLGRVERWRAGKHSAVATAASRIDVRSVQSTGGAVPKWAMTAAECSGSSSSTGPGATGRVPISTSEATRDGWSSANSCAMKPPVAKPAT
jgi:hypothetical protein